MPDDPSWSDRALRDGHHRLSTALITAATSPAGSSAHPEEDRPEDSPADVPDCSPAGPSAGSPAGPWAHPEEDRPEDSPADAPDRSPAVPWAGSPEDSPNRTAVGLGRARIPPRHQEHQTKLPTASARAPRTRTGRQRATTNREPLGSASTPRPVTGRLPENDRQVRFETSASFTRSSLYADRR